MTPTRERAEDVLRQVVQGKKHWRDLDTIEYFLQVEGEHCSINNPHRWEAAATVFDLAQGFLAFRNDSRKLREWAFVVEALDVDLDVANHPAGETLLDALWRASFGEPLEDEFFQLAEQVTQTNRSVA